MACMDHYCKDCQTVWMDNKRSGICPKCKSTRIVSFWDEEGDDKDERDFDYPEESRPYGEDVR